MSTKNDRATRRHFVQLLDKHRPFGAQIVTDELVVHNLMSHINWRAKLFQGALDNGDGTFDTGRKTAADRGNTIYQFTPAQREEFVKLSARIDDEWVADLDKRGHKGKELLATARSLIAKHGKA